MTASHYALGSTDAEHARLVRQAAWLAPVTERLFREAGIKQGQRVLDLGSGVGDVALIAARLVGPSGSVVGIERDARSIERARARMMEARLENVTLVQCDAGDFASDEPFDAAVGRYILMFLPDPASALSAIARAVRPGGVLAFQEPDWTSFLRCSHGKSGIRRTDDVQSRARAEEVTRLPLWSVGASLLVETFQRCGTNTDMGNALPRVFEDVGLPAPAVRVECLLGAESWLPDCLHSLRSTMADLGLALEALGDFETLHERLRGEVSALGTRTPLPSIVSAWCRKPSDLD